jgi:hypothetical protein
MKRIAFLAVLVAALMLPPSAAASAEWSWPVRGDVVTPYRNGDDPYAAGQHRGIDIAAPAGTRVNAAVAGRVTYVGTAGSSGLTVGVRTSDDRYDVSYLHLSAAGVHEGDAVEGGDAIGAVGTTGRRSVDQPHLHFGVREAGQRQAYRDPLDFLPPVAPPAGRPEPPPAIAAAPEPTPAPPAAAPAFGGLDATAPAVAALAPGAAAAPSTAPAATSRGPSPRPAVHGAHLLVGPRDARGRAPHASASRVAGAPRGEQVTASDAAGGRFREPAKPRPHRTDATAGAGPRGAAGSTSPPAVAPPARHAGRPPSHHGVDVGWLAALIGLIAASVCLGRPQDAARAARGGRATVGALLRPLTGRS